MSVPVDWDVSEDMPDQVITKLLKDKNRRLTQQLAGLLEHQGKTLQKLGDLEMKALMLERQLEKSGGNGHEHFRKEHPHHREFQG